MATETVILSSRNLRELQLPNVAIASDYNRGANNQVDYGAGIWQGSKEKKKKASCLEVSIEEKLHHTLSPGVFRKSSIQ